MARRKSFNETLRDAINDVSQYGFDSKKRIEDWLEALRRSAEATLTSEKIMDRMLREALASIYKRMIDRGGIIQYHPGLKKFTLENLKPSLRAELDRRIMASADLIKLNREEAIQKTLRRFEGWSTSIPKGGSDAVRKRKAKENIRKGIAGNSFVERRIIIDQGHKLVASISEIVANDQGAIAMIWHSHWREQGYDYREDHKERDGKVYLLRDSWAKRKGYVKAAKVGYYDDITKVGEEVYCRCYAQWIYNLRSMPDDMLTEKGKQALADAKARLSRMDDAEKSTKKAHYVGAGEPRPDHSQCNDEAAFGDAQADDDVVMAYARELDALSYLHGLKRFELVSDRDKWNASYDPDEDRIAVEGKFEAKHTKEKLHILLHEAGHRGQEVDPETYEDFKARRLNQEKYFLAMANETHMRDYRCRGHVDNLAEEVFAESYSRYALGLHLGPELAAFWRERFAEQARIG